MTMLAASCQSPASAACRTASVSWPFRSYHRAARRCRGAIRSGYSRLSLSRSTSANNGWYRYHPDPVGWTNPFARAKAGRIAAACSLPVSSLAAWALTRSRMDVLSRTSRAVRRRGVENLRHQVAGQGAVLGDQLGDELVRVGMGAHRDRGQPQPGRPALRPPGQALQRARRQRDAVPGQQQAGFGDGERQVAGPDLGQLAGQPVAVQRQRRVHPRGRPPGAGPALCSAARSQARSAPWGRSADAGRPGPASPAGPGPPAPTLAAARRRARRPVPARRAPPPGAATPDRRSAATT